MKTNINDILKPGGEKRIKIIDYNSPKKRKELAELKKKRDECLRNKNVDWDKLSRIYMTI